MKVLITGGADSVGTSLIPYLLDKDYKVGSEQITDSYANV